MGTVILTALILSSFIAAESMALTPQYYPACYQPVKQLEKITANFEEAVFSNIVKGILSGAGGNKSGEGMAGMKKAFGGLSAALSGFGSSGGGAQPNPIANILQIMSSLTQDSEILKNGIDETSVAATEANKCYSAEFDSLISQAKAKSISQDEAMARYGEIKAGRAEIAKLRNKNIKKTEEKESQLKTAFDKEKEKNPTMFEVQDTPPPTSATASTKTVAYKDKKVEAAAANLRGIEDAREKAKREATAQAEADLADDKELEALL